MTIIEIRPYRNGWKVFEAPGVEPVFLKREPAIDYATCRACFRSGEIRILDLTGNVERAIHFLRNSLARFSGPFAYSIEEFQRTAQITF